MQPLVSVLIPAYNALPTLPWAVASLQAQTHENWEALIVDDGSTDGTADFVTALRDPRVRFFRQETNCGRGQSRQRAAEEARGPYIAMLDADDWLFPDRLQKQVAALESDPRIRLVGSGAAIVDREQRLTGIRGLAASPTVRTMKTLGPAPVVFAASMYRRTPGCLYFNKSYTFAEDSDFVIRFLLGHRYLMLPDLGYVYCEHASATPGKMARAHRCTATIYLAYRDMYPIRSLLLASMSLLKAGIWAAPGSQRLSDWLIRRRSRRPSPLELEKYLCARQVVSEQVRRLGDAEKPTCAA